MTHKPLPTPAEAIVIIFPLLTLLGGLSLWFISQTDPAALETATTIQFSLIEFGVMFVVFLLSILWAMPFLPGRM